MKTELTKEVEQALVLATKADGVGGRIGSNTG